MIELFAALSFVVANQPDVVIIIADDFGNMT